MLRYRTDAIPFEQFAAETGYNDLDPNREDQAAERKEIRDHYLNFNAEQFANQSGETLGTVRRQFGSAIDQYDRTLSESRAGTNLTPETVPDGRVTATSLQQNIEANAEPDSFGQDLFDAAARGFTTGLSNTVSGLGVLGNTAARQLVGESDFGLDLANFGEELTRGFEKQFQIDPENQGFVTDVAEGIGQFASIFVGGLGAGAAVRVGARAAGRFVPNAVGTIGRQTALVTPAIAQQSSNLVDRYIQSNPEGTYDQETINGLVLGSIGLGVMESILPNRILGNTAVTNSVLNRIIRTRPLQALRSAGQAAVIEGATEAVQTVLEDVIVASEVSDEELEEAIDTAFDNISADTTGRAGAVGGATGFAVGLVSALVRPRRGRSATRAQAQPEPQTNPITGAPVAAPVEVQPVVSPDPDLGTDGQFEFDGRVFTVVEDTLDPTGQTGQVILNTDNGSGQLVNITIDRSRPEAGRFLDAYVAQRNERSATNAALPDSFGYSPTPDTPVQPVAAAQDVSPQPAPARTDGDGGGANLQQRLANLRVDVQAPRNDSRLARFGRLSRRNLLSGGALSIGRTDIVRDSLSGQPETVQRVAELYDSGLRQTDVEIRQPLTAYQQAIREDFRRGPTAQVAAQLNAALHGDTQALESLPESTQNELLNMRDQINRRSAEIGTELQAVGERMQGRLDLHVSRFGDDAVATDIRNALTQINNQVAAVQANLPNDANPLGTYVHRIYGVYHDTNDLNAAFDQSGQRYQNFVNYIARQHLASNPQLTEIQASDRAVSDAEALRIQITEAGQAVGFNRDRQILSSISALRERQRVPAPVRQFLGEVTDVQTAFSATIQQQRTIISSFEMANNLETLGFAQGWLTDQPNQTTGSIIPFRSSSNNPALAMMNGYYAPQWVVDGMNDHFRQDNLTGVLRTIRGALSAVKIGKTVFSVSTSARNFASGLWSVGVNGGYNARGISESFGLVKEIMAGRGGTAYHQELTRLGVVGDGVSTGTIREFIRDAQHIDPVGLLDNDINAQPTGRNALSTGFRSVQRFATRAYAASDDMPKIIGYEQNRTLLAEAYGLDRDDARVKEEAAVRVRDTYFTYSKVANIIKSARLLPFGPPFISFPAEVYRTSYNLVRYSLADLRSGNPVLQRSARNRLISAAATIGITANLGAIIGEALEGFSDDDEESIDTTEQERELMKEFMEFGRFTTGNDLQVTRRLDDRRYEMVNMSRYNPYAGVSDAFGTIMKGDPTWPQALWNGVMQAASPFWQPDITLQALNDAQRAYELAPGSDVDKTAAYLGSVVKNISPTSITQANNIFKAHTGDLQHLDGSNRTAVRETAKFFGATTDVVDPLVFMGFKGNNIVDAIRAASGAESFSIRGLNQGDVNQQAFLNQLQNIDREWSRAQRGIQILGQLGYDTSIGGEVYQSMVAGKRGNGRGKLSKELTTALVNGLPYPGLKAPENAIENAERRTRFFQGEEAATETRRQAIEKSRKLRSDR